MHSFYLGGDQINCPRTLMKTDSETIWNSWLQLATLVHLPRPVRFQGGSNACSTMVLMLEIFSLLIDFLYFVYSDHSYVSHWFFFLFYILTVRFFLYTVLICFFLSVCQDHQGNPTEGKTAALYRDEVTSLNSMEAMSLKPHPWSTWWFQFSGCLSPTLESCLLLSPVQLCSSCGVRSST